MRIESRADSSAAAAAFLAAATLVFFLPLWLRGLSPYWGDLTYLHQGWRAAPAQLIQAGRAPLWEPSLYLGMPMAASMQGGLLYPPGILFDAFGFATATALFEALHVFLAGWLAALWLRSLRLSWGASVGGGLSFALGGLMISRLPWLNHLATLAWAPALLLFFRRPSALAAALALAFLAGYPTFLPGLALVAWALAALLRARGAPPVTRWAAVWAAAMTLAVALSAAQLIPALELAAHSRRAGGVERAEALTWSFVSGDLRQWISPLVVELFGKFRPAVDWWKCVYLGLIASAAAVRGLLILPRGRAAGLVLILAAVVLLILGSSNPFSRALWLGLAPLRFVRYPGNLAYLASLPLLALVGAGLSRARRAPALAAALAVELLACGWYVTPAAPRDFFVEAGPLVRLLQAHLGATRYLISPLALETDSGRDVVDWKTRLYGVTNAPYRLRAAANFGEPLVPKDSYAFMEALYSLPGAAAAAAWLPWAGASCLLTRDAPSSTPLLIPEGRALWFVSRAAQAVSTAYWFDPVTGAALPAILPARPPVPGRPLKVERPREDRLSVSGEGGGWVFLSEPRYPGWRAELDGPYGSAGAEPVPALGPFQKFRVPAGRWTLRLVYDPRSWRAGVLLSLAALLGLGGYWYHRLSRLNHVA
ncbi:MAG: hypothetical protein HKL90_10530 [Elusimicrobia bacterium]|nr:hypothetical protein [Elusimicrobiota bacterium]